MLLIRHTILRALFGFHPTKLNQTFRSFENLNKKLTLMTTMRDMPNLSWNVMTIRSRLWLLRRSTSPIHGVVGMTPSLRSTFSALKRFF